MIFDKEVIHGSTVYKVAQCVSNLHLNIVVGELTTVSLKPRVVLMSFKLHHHTVGQSLETFQLIDTPFKLKPAYVILGTDGQMSN